MKKTLKHKSKKASDKAIDKKVADLEKKGYKVENIFVGDFGLLRKATIEYSKNN